MRELSLYSGAGGGLLGSLLLGWKPVCYVEKDSYCRGVLRQRIADGYLPDAPIYDDVRNFDGRAWRGRVDVITGGFPCQPFSVAGRQRGEADERNLWPETIRIIREVGPHFCLLENVPGLVSSGYLGTVLGDLAASGFDAEWDVFSAAGVGAPHLRKRLWILAYAEGMQWPEILGHESDGVLQSDVAYADEQRDGWETHQVCSGGNASLVCSADVANSHLQHGDRARHGAGEICRERGEAAALLGGSSDTDRQRFSERAEPDRATITGGETPQRRSDSDGLRDDVADFAGNGFSRTDEGTGGQGEGPQAESVEP